MQDHDVEEDPVVRAEADPEAEDLEAVDAQVEPAAQLLRPRRTALKRSWFSLVQMPEAHLEPNVELDPDAEALLEAKVVVASKAAQEIRNLISPAEDFSRI